MQGILFGGMVRPAFAMARRRGDPQVRLASRQGERIGVQRSL